MSGGKQCEGKMEGDEQQTAMQSKHLDQPQEVIMEKFSCSLPVLTSMTLRAFGASSVSRRSAFYFPLKDHF